MSRSQMKEILGERGIMANPDHYIEWWNLEGDPIQVWIKNGLIYKARRMKLPYPIEPFLAPTEWTAESDDEKRFRTLLDLLTAP